MRRSNTLPVLTALALASGVAAAPAASAAPAEQHCVVRPSGHMDCYRDFAEAISSATQGRVNLKNAHSARFISDLEMEPQMATSTGVGSSARPAGTAAAYIDAVDYADYNFGGSTLTFTQTSACSQGGQFFYGTMPTGWNDRIGSVKTYGGCTQTLYEQAQYGQPQYAAVGNVANLGSMNDRASSTILRS